MHKSSPYFECFSILLLKTVQCLLTEWVCFTQVVEVDEPLTDGRTVGRIVWAKLTARCKAWPAMTIRGSDAAQSPASADNQWVFWYGEHKVSEVRLVIVRELRTIVFTASHTLYSRIFRVGAVKLPNDGLWIWSKFRCSMFFVSPILMKWVCRKELQIIFLLGILSKLLIQLHHHDLWMDCIWCKVLPPIFSPLASNYQRSLW